MLAPKFGMEFVDRDGQKKAPYILHRTSLGCYERTLALMIEKYAGAMPVWIAPEQVRIMTINESFIPYAEEQAKKLSALGVRVTVDGRTEKIGYKIREARNERLPYMLVVGEKEAEAGLFAVRKRGEGELGQMSVADFTAKLLEDISTRAIW